jgi:hypothetical protein
MTQTYVIERASRITEINVTPTEGVWYSGVNAQGQTGAVVRFCGPAGFFNSTSDHAIDMTGYAFLRESMPAQHSAIARPDRQKPNQEVRQALRWLETLISSQASSSIWNEHQRQACQDALEAAKVANGQ